MQLLYTYDHQFQREALARKDLNWSITDPRLYNKAFTELGQWLAAHSVSRMSTLKRCAQRTHTALCSDVDGSPHQPGHQLPPSQRHHTQPTASKKYGSTLRMAAAVTPSANTGMLAVTVRGSTLAWIDCPRIKKGHSRSPHHTQSRCGGFTLGQLQAATHLRVRN